MGKKKAQKISILMFGASSRDDQALLNIEDVHGDTWELTERTAAKICALFGITEAHGAGKQTCLLQVSADIDDGMLCEYAEFCEENLHTAVIRTTEAIESACMLLDVDAEIRVAFRGNQYYKDIDGRNLVGSDDRNWYQLIQHFDDYGALTDEKY
jgi:hypothetical protein